MHRALPLPVTACESRHALCMKKLECTIVEGGEAGVGKITAGREGRTAGKWEAGRWCVVCRHSPCTADHPTRRGEMLLP